MKLEIENFAKIKKTVVVVDGITVIAGENDSGKSTVGKILFSIFNSTFDIEEKIRNQRMREILSRYFENVFSGQVNSLRNPESTAYLTLDIKGKRAKLVFKGNVCTEYASEISILNKAVYIDNPFLTDRLSSEYSSSLIEQSLKDMLMHHPEDNLMKGVIGSEPAKEKLSEVYRKLSTVIQGKILERQQDEYFLDQEGFKDPVPIDGLSSGLKSFLILKMLIEKGQIDQKDVIILDEPEVHLHPKWQIIYAEMIVLLQKCLDLSIIITTHSPYFMDAVNLFSVKYGLGEKANYYLASVEDGWAKLENVSENIDKIYQMMASPIQILDTLRYELNNI